MIQSLIGVLSGRRVDLVNCGGDKDYPWVAVKLTDPDEVIILAGHSNYDGTVLVRKASPQDIQKVEVHAWYGWNHPRGVPRRAWSRGFGVMPSGLIPPPISPSDSDALKLISLTPVSTGSLNPGRHV